MPICEKCWDLAFAKMKENPGKSQAEHYELIVKYHNEPWPCSHNNWLDCKHPECKLEAGDRVELSASGHEPKMLPLHQPASKKGV